MKLTKKAVFIGSCIALASIFYDHNKSMRFAEAHLQDLGVIDAKLSWETCEGGAWCKISDLPGSLGPNGNERFTNFYNTNGTYVVWIYTNGRPFVLKGMYKENLGDAFGDLGIHFSQNKETTFISWTEGRADRYDMPWAGMGPYYSINIPDR